MASITIPEFLITDTFTSAAQQANNTKDFVLTLTSSVWTTTMGTVVTVNLEQSFDNGATWVHVAGFTATSGPLNAAPHDGMPAVAVGLPGRGNRRLRVRVIVSAPIRLGATLVFV